MYNTWSFKWRSIAYSRIEKSALKNLYISDTIPVKPVNKDGILLPEKIKIVTCASAIAKVISAINEKSSVDNKLKSF
jgi:phosphoribosylpyrophosphate synthetase